MLKIWLNKFSNMKRDIQELYFGLLFNKRIRKGG